MSVPVRKGPWWYLTRTKEGLQYPVHVRQADVDGQPSGIYEIVFDENIAAGDSEYFAVGDMLASPDHRLLAVSTDYDGDEQYSLQIIELATGEVLGDHIEGLTYGVSWAND